MTLGFRESNGASEFVPNTHSNCSKTKCRCPEATPKLLESNRKSGNFSYAGKPATKAAMGGENEAEAMGLKA